MKNFLKNLKMSSFITELPQIINYNNEAIKDEFDMIVDPDTGYLKRSLVNKSGKVEAFWGIFKNVDIENLVFRNPVSLRQAISGASLEHNVLSKRFYSDWQSVTTGDTSVNSFDPAKDFCHDPRVISSGNDDMQSLHERLLAIESVIESGASISTASTFSMRSAASSNIENDSEMIDAANGSATGYYYNEDVMNSIDKASTLRVIKNDKDIDDLKKGLLFYYVDATNATWCKVNTSKCIMLINAADSQIVNILIEQSNAGETLDICLSRETYECIRISANDGIIDGDLISISLIRDEASKKWRLYNYSLPSSNYSLTKFSLI